jgi:hypothetical protein
MSYAAKAQQLANLKPLKINKRDEAFLPEFFNVCFSKNKTISNISNLCNVLGINLSIFSTEHLAGHKPSLLIDIRLQHKQPNDENWNESGSTRTWIYKSERSHMRLSSYSEYQQSPGSSTRRGHNLIKFGTNVDLSDEETWADQLKELEKLPPFMRLVSDGNMLDHVGYKVLGVNTVQMYLKVAGCRTPAHQENNNLCSININIGPGDCEWFGVDEEHWKSIAKMCKDNGCDYLKGSWWPNLEDLTNAEIPVFRFIQKPGDLVWVNVGCVHWVQSLGSCNNISWNVGPLVYLQYKASLERYELNKLESFMSIVPMNHLSWRIAESTADRPIVDMELFNCITDVLKSSLEQCHREFEENHQPDMKYHDRKAHEQVKYCNECNCELFNIFLVHEQAKPNKLKPVYCKTCASSKNVLKKCVVFYKYKMSELQSTFDNFQLTRAEMPAYKIVENKRPASNDTDDNPAKRSKMEAVANNFSGTNIE